MYAEASGGKIGITLNNNYAYGHHPEDPNQQNIVNGQEAQSLLWFTEPIFGSGDYYYTTKNLMGNLTLLYPAIYLPVFTEEEIEQNRGSADFFGLNFYNGNLLPALFDQEDDVAVNYKLIYDELPSEVRVVNGLIEKNNSKFFE